MLDEAGVDNADPTKVEVVITIAPDEGSMIDKNRIKQWVYRWILSLLAEINSQYCNFESFCTNLGRC